MMEFEIEQAIEILSRTPKILKAWLSDISNSWANCNEGDDTWSPFDVVGHFIHGEQTDWIPRAQLILSGNDDVPEFEPFDRFAQFEASEGKTMPELLAAFAQLRAKNLETLRGFKLQPADYGRQGKHPDLGVVNLRQLLATWVVHDLDHLGQIGQVMARQYHDEVGPWGAYLTILEAS